MGKRRPFPDYLPVPRRCWKNYCSIIKEIRTSIGYSEFTDNKQNIVIAASGGVENFSEKPQWILFDSTYFKVRNISLPISLMGRYNAGNTLSDPNLSREGREDSRVCRR